MFGRSDYDTRLTQAVKEDRRQAALNHVARLVDAGRLAGLNSDRLLEVAAKVEAYLATGAVPTDEVVAAATVNSMVDDA
jgi:hypothetical protein